jgi:hypothetical protein
MKSKKNVSILVVVVVVVVVVVFWGERLMTFIILSVVLGNGTALNFISQKKTNPSHLRHHTRIGPALTFFFFLHQAPA